MCGSAQDRRKSERPVEENLLHAEKFINLDMDVLSLSYSVVYDNIEDYHKLLSRIGLFQRERCYKSFTRFYIKQTKKDALAEAGKGVIKTIFLQK